MKTLSHPKKSEKGAAKAAAGGAPESIARKHHIVMAATDMYIIKRRGNADESRRLAGLIIDDAEARTSGIDSKKLLSAMRNRRV